jgi:uncharacterized protein YndB with AHSA1/START domain
VFDAWLDPQLIGAWMFGHATPDEEVVRIAVDPRVGGSFSFVVRRNGQEIDHVGEYLEIERPRRLVFTWAVRENLPETSRVTIEITPATGGADLTLTHELDPKWAGYAERTEEGWTKILTALARVR